VQKTPERVFFFSQTNFKGLVNIDEMREKSEEQSEPYGLYGERVPELLTKQLAIFVEPMRALPYWGVPLLQKMQSNCRPQVLPFRHVLAPMPMHGGGGFSAEVRF
jgi:hypothetical protein